jgi:hypothetical protein
LFAGIRIVTAAVAAAVAAACAVANSVAACCASASAAAWALIRSTSRLAMARWRALRRRSYPGLAR